VSRRTVFRHFPTHDELMAEAVTSLLDSIRSDLDGDFGIGEEVDAWLEALTVRLHRRIAQDYGQAFWDLQRPDPERPEVFAAAVRAIPERRAQYASQVAVTAWTASGGPGDPPPLLVEAIALLGSGFGANSLASGTCRTPEETGRLAAAMMSAILRDALAHQPGTLPVRATANRRSDRRSSP
jgi:AcrR family transcriptional regulator